MDASDEVFAELYDFARLLGYDHDNAALLARSVMAEYGPSYVAAAKLGSMEMHAMFMAIAATRRPGGGSA
jgi:hypothetical protein